MLTTKYGDMNYGRIVRDVYFDEFSSFF
jgi:hypothetical protein